MKYLAKSEGYKKAIRMIADIARRRGTTAHAVAMDYLSKNRNQIEAYVRQWGGQEPAYLLSDLVVQAAIIHENLVAAKQASGVPDYEVAENSVLQRYAEAEDLGHVDEFDPVTIGAIFTGAKNLISGINQNRAAKGKPPLLASKKKKELFYKTQAEQRTLDETGSVAQNNPTESQGLGQIINGVLQPIRQAETRQAINSALPIGIPIVIGIVALVFFMGKKL